MTRLLSKSYPTDTPLSAADHYRESLREIGRLAAFLDEHPDYPLDALLEYYEADEADKKIIIEAYHRS